MNAEWANRLHWSFQYKCNNRHTHTLRLNLPVTFAGPQWSPPLLPSTYTQSRMSKIVYTRSDIQPLFENGGGGVNRKFGKLTCCIFSKSRQGRWMWWWERWAWRWRLRGDPILLPLATDRAAGSACNDNMAAALKGAAISSRSARKNFGGGERERVGRWAPSGGDVRNSSGRGESWGPPTSDWTSSSDEAEQSNAAPTLLMLRSIGSFSIIKPWCNKTAERGRLFIRSLKRRWFTWPHFRFSGPYTKFIKAFLLFRKKKRFSSLPLNFSTNLRLNNFSRLLLIVVVVLIRAETGWTEGTGTKT